MPPSRHAGQGAFNTSAGAGGSVSGAGLGGFGVSSGSLNVIDFSPPGE
jgi:hypothetical protein